MIRLEKRISEAQSDLNRGYAKAITRITDNENKITQFHEVYKALQKNFVDQEIILKNEKK